VKEISANIQYVDIETNPLATLLK